MWERERIPKVSIYIYIHIYTICIIYNLIQMLVSGCLCASTHTDEYRCSMTSAGSSHDGSTSFAIASVLHTAHDQTHVEPPFHLATGGRELYTMIAVDNGGDDGMIGTFQHQRM